MSSPGFPLIAGASLHGSCPRSDQERSLSRNMMGFKRFAPRYNILQGESSLPVGEGNGNHIFLAE